MSNSGRPVVLLSRPGVARDRMREALELAGARIVLDADPTATDEAAVLAVAPEVVLVVLDAAVDEAIDRFSGLLADPSIDVIFEEAELAASRVGWDAARWVRHLSAKLHHSDNVLPPGREPDAAAVVVPVDVHASMDLVTVELGDEAANYTNHHPTETTTQVAPMELGLVEDDESPKITVEGLELDDDDPDAANRFRDEMADLESRIASMQLVDDRSPAAIRGAVLVLAGIGGPDAVRQLLGALPEGFPRPVLVQQRLDGGRYDKLVAQMQRATALSVQLAEPGQPAQAATVYIVPPIVGVQDGASGLVFIELPENGTPLDVLDALPAGDSAVLLLSGSDPAQVDTALKCAAAGALVAGQAPDGCYDAAAPDALVARGGDVGKPHELAARLAARWCN
jgi:chemosensory pili system protein ChpB (putative protein-glutamate methylesterase)